MEKELSNFDYWEKRGTVYRDLDDVKSKRTAYKIVSVIKSMSLNYGSWILDAGCGKGDITEIVRDNIRHSNVMGVDLSKEMIDGAKLKERSGLRFVCSDFFDFISDIKNFFDLIISSLFIHHLTKGRDQFALEKMYDSLKKNGRVLIAEAIPPEENIFDYYKEIFKIKEDRNCYLLRDLSALLKKAGFVRVKHLTYRFDIRLNSWLNDPTISKEKRLLLYLMHTEASQEFKKAYAMDPLSDGDYRLRCKMALVTGTKV